MRPRSCFAIDSSQLFFALVAFLVMSCLPSADNVSAEEKSDPYAALYDVVMTRTGPDGKAYAQDESSPAIFHSSRFPFGNRTFDRFNSALDAFAALSQREIEEYSDVQRALMQRHLWEVYDTTVPYSWRIHDLQPRAEARPKIASLIRRLALSRAEILSLPNTMVATAESGGFATAHDPREPFRPFFPVDLNASHSSWVCIGVSGHPISGIRHTEKLNFRSTFLHFIRLPNGREETLKYLAKRLESNFPIGTEVALIEQAFLISDEGEMILSPLVVSVQLRAFLEVDRHAYLARPEATQAVAEFVMQPREMIQGRAAMKALRPADHRYGAGDEEMQDFTSYDPFERSAMPKTTRLNICVRCHGRGGIRSMNTVGFRSPRRTLREGDPDSIASATVIRKQEDESWKTLQQNWRDGIPR